MENLTSDSDYTDIGIDGAFSDSFYIPFSDGRDLFITNRMQAAAQSTRDDIDMFFEKFEKTINY